MRCTWSSHIILLLSLAVLVGVLAGCDNTIEPFADETGLFSVYGYVEVDQSPNYVRVKDLNDPNIRDSTETIDATVTLENLHEGTTEELEHVIDTFDDVYVHNFRAEMPITPETAYRITVERSDGRSVVADTETPEITQTTLGPEGASCTTTLTTTFHEITNPRLVQAEIGFQHEGTTRWIRRSVDRGRGGDVLLRFIPEAILGEIIESQDDPDNELIYTPRCQELDDEIFHVRYNHLGPDWLDQDLPIDPLESRDVEDGLGFFGGMRTDTVSVQVDTTEIILPPQ